jgi:hypothetical protein
MAGILIFQSFLKGKPKMLHFRALYRDPTEKPLGSKFQSNYLYCPGKGSHHYIGLSFESTFVELLRLEFF